MKKVKNFTLFLYHHNLIRYLFVGGTTFIIDLSLLYVLHAKLNMNLELATSIAYWTSIAYNFMLNRSWTFTNTEKKKLHEHALFYIVLLSFNYTYTLLTVSILSHYIYFATAKIIAVITQTSWTYYLYKNYVFGQSEGYHALKTRFAKTLKKVRTLRLWLLFIAVFLYTGLFFSAFQFHALNTANSVDGSWSYALSSLRHHPDQSLGNSTFFTYGPLSVRVITTVYHADSFNDYLLSTSLLTVIFLLCVGTVFYAARRLSAGNLMALTGLLLLLQFGETSIDGLAFATLLATVLVLFMRYDTLSLPKQCLLLLGPLILSTYKNNLLIAAAMICTLAVLASRGWRRAAKTAAALGALYYVLLVLEGVSVLNVPRFLVYSLRDAFSYNEFMSLSTNGRYTVTFFVFLLFFGTFLFVSHYVKPRLSNRYKVEDLRIALPLLAELGVLWIIFKEAATRSDGHIIIFFPFIFYMIARLLATASRPGRQRLQLSFIPIALLGVGTYIFMTVPHLLQTTSHPYLKRTVKNIAWLEVAHQYNHSYFEYQRTTSEQQFDGLRQDVSQFRSLYKTYVKTHHQAQIVGYTTSIYYMPAITDQYLYAPFLQTYQAFPPSLFDPIFKQYLVHHPDLLVFWSNLNPSIDGRMPTGDLPQTFDYIRNHYSVAVENKGLFLYARNNRGSSYAQAHCQAKSTESYTNTPTELLPGTRQMQISIHDKARLPIDILYKKPVYHIFLYDKQDREMIFRTTPSLLEAGIHVAPLHPSLVEDTSTQFTVNRFMVSASDEREAPITIGQEVCRQ